jgi:hypothetical protein
MDGIAELKIESSNMSPIERLIKGVVAGGDGIRGVEDKDESTAAVEDEECCCWYECR